jgi:hypothetical protein
MTGGNAGSQAMPSGFCLKFVSFLSRPEVAALTLSTTLLTGGPTVSRDTLRDTATK